MRLFLENSIHFTFIFVILRLNLKSNISFVKDQRDVFSLCILLGKRMLCLWFGTSRDMQYSRCCFLWRYILLLHDILFQHIWIKEACSGWTNASLGLVKETIPDFRCRRDEGESGSTDKMGKNQPIASNLVIIQPWAWRCATAISPDRAEWTKSWG